MTSVLTLSCPPACDARAPIALLPTLLHALEDSQLQLVYQPQVSLTGAEVTGLEALVRWHHPDRGLVLPDNFVPAAESSHLGCRLTSFVVDAAMAAAARFRRQGTPVPVAVNVCATDLRSGRLVRAVSEALSRHGLPSGALVLEVTEREPLGDPAELRRVLGQLRNMGVALSLDDFGAGHASVSTLRGLDPDEVKIDRQFVARCTRSNSDASFVRSVIELGSSLGLRTVAEGVEHSDVWDRLRGWGCDIAQGWYVGRPMPADAVADWLRARPVLLPAQRPAVD